MSLLDDIRIIQSANDLKRERENGDEKKKGQNFFFSFFSLLYGRLLYKEPNTK
jgi:hypothetical protein